MWNHNLAVHDCKKNVKSFGHRCNRNINERIYSVLKRKKIYIIITVGLKNPAMMGRN